MAEQPLQVRWSIFRKCIRPGSTSGKAWAKPPKGARFKASSAGWLSAAPNELLVVGCAIGIMAGSVQTWAQIDPERRELIQVGYNQPVEGKGPLAVYAYYYGNRPGWLQTNLTLRTVIAPTYLDAELGIKDLLGPNTDLGIGLAGGGYADSYAEIHNGNWQRAESFLGHGGDLSVSVYHLFNPLPNGVKPTSLGEVPLVGLGRVGSRFSVFANDDGTDPRFKLPDNKYEFYVRTGVRWGGREPLLYPDTAVEASLWYEGHFRTESQEYGYNDDRKINGDSHRFWGRALAAYTFEPSRHRAEISVTAGTSAGTDRFTAYRLGGTLPLAAEFPLVLPGYYFQELSAQKFALASATYTIPIGSRFEFIAQGSTAMVDFLQGFESGGNWQSGAGGYFGYHSLGGHWHVLAGYSYGFNAVRGDHVGAQNISLLMQYDLEGAMNQPSGERFRQFFNRLNQNVLSGLEEIFGR